MMWHEMVGLERKWRITEKEPSTSVLATPDDGTSRRESRSRLVQLNTLVCASSGRWMFGSTCLEHIGETVKSRYGSADEKRLL